MCLLFVVWLVVFVWVGVLCVVVVGFCVAVLGWVWTVYFVIVIKSIRKKRGTDEEDR